MINIKKIPSTIVPNLYIRVHHDILGMWKNYKIDSLKNILEYLVKMIFNYIFIIIYFKFF